ncbi:MAG: hypothetical protein EP298_00825 [Gammaproteobacteria bacterium]|nr:MAG: hypothetical protein EP298_00825 [Gammaproteobacteria bacterium]UTW41838.1 hypothetical protein KFE69_10035 [bacterium SCSIO 12844]
MIENNNQHLKCFSLPEITIAPPSIAITNWWQKFANTRLILNDQHANYLAKLLPFLLCGEQSALCIFDNEVNRLKSKPITKAITDLQKVVNDEYYHEQLLQHLSGKLPKPPEVNRIKKKAKLFYTKLGNKHTLANHFSLISQLDRCTCKILNAMEQSHLNKNPAITHLFKIIKQDEARHVFISKQHASNLGSYNTDETITQELIKLLSIQSDTFEGLGIDFDLLTQRLITTKL